MTSEHPSGARAQPRDRVAPDQPAVQEQARAGPQFFERAARTRNLLRVVEDVGDAGHADRIGDLYTESARTPTSRARPNSTALRRWTRSAWTLAFADALADESFDEAIRSVMADALSLVGEDVGTSIIAVECSADRAGLFGPVITRLPDMEAALRLWDGFVMMVGTDGFFELKWTR